MKRPPQAQTSPLFLAFLASGVVLAGLIAWLALDRPQAPAAAPAKLILYCAASVRTPIEAIARDYEKECGVRIEPQFGASQALLTSAAISNKGDLYLPADDSYITEARQKNLLADEFPLGVQHPVLAVRKGNPKQIKTLDDLLRSEVKLAQANPDAAAIGKVTRDLLSKTGQWNAIAAHTYVFTGTVVEAANALKLGSADAAFIYDAMASQYTDVELIPIPALVGAESKLIVAVLKSSGQPDAARQFAQYLAAADKGLPYFKRFGFTIEIQKSP